MASDEIARRSVRGSLILFVGNFASTAVSAVAIIIVARLLGPDGYGAYSLAFVLPGLMQVFVGLGVNTSIIRYSTYYISTGRPEEAKRFTLNGIYFLTLVGALIAAVNFFLAGPLSSVVLHRPELTPDVELASVFVLGYTLFQAIIAAGIGWNWYGLASLSQIGQSILRLVAAPLLIIAGLGVYGAILGQVAAQAMAGILGGLALYAIKLRGRSSEVSRFVKDTREMVSYGLPVFAGSLASGLATYYVSILLAAIASNSIIGFYQAAVNLTSPIALVASAVASALFPAFASLDGIGGSMQLALRTSVKYVAFMVAPIAIFVAASSDALIGAFYGSNYAPGGVYLFFLAIAQVPVAMGAAILPVFFSGFGRTRLTMYASLSGALALAALAPLASIAWGFGVNGLIYSVLVSNIAILVAGALLARRGMKARLEVESMVAILVVSITSGVLAYLVPFSGQPGFALVAKAAVFFFAYLTLAPIAGAINSSDIRVLGTTLGELRIIGKLVSPVLRYQKFILTLGHEVHDRLGTRRRA